MNKIAQVPIGDTFFGKTGHFLADLPGLGQLVSLIANNAIVVAGVIFLFLIIFAGFQMITAGGDSQKFQQGQNIITAGFIGFIIVLAAFLIVRFIESSLDTGEYIAFDVSTDGGASFVEKVRLRGNVDPENKWHSVSLELSGLSALKLRFRGTMNSTSEDANVDNVKVVAW